MSARSLSSKTAALPRTGLLLAATFLFLGCEPTVKLKAPEKPIVVNLNVKIEREVKVKVDEEVDKLLQENREIF
ncbi:MAG: YnbE family lipoprotein [Pirellulales bacterium]|nr:YnbE family lipoprotein [Pirellulales bacterium]